MTRLASIIARAPLGPARALWRGARQPLATQERVLRRLVRHASATAVGREFGFPGVGRAGDVVSAYRDTVPLQSYEDISDLVARVRGGEADVMWPGQARDFAVSSGTASSGKIIPLSRETLRNNVRFSLAVAQDHFAQTGDTAMWAGKMLSIPGRIEEDPQYPGTLVGEVSGFQSKYAPFWLSRKYRVVPDEILFMDNWDRKLDAVVERTVDQDIRVLVMVPSWALVLFDKLLARYRQQFGRQAEHVLDVWPNLRVFFSGGVALSSYRDLLARRIGGPIHFVESYGASEGYFATQSGPEGSGLLVHVDNGVFYEFVPLEQVGLESPDRLWIGDVETGVRYALYVSTCSGLWSYAVGDVIRFTSLSPYRLVVAGRTSEMIDKYGEAVFGEEARTALEKACQGTGAAVADYHIAPGPVVEGSLPAHDWIIEFERPPENAVGFAQSIDEHLQNVNRHYQIRREAGAFLGPNIVAVPRGTFGRWLETARGHVSAQSKVPRMSQERAIADSVLRIAAERADES